jgi:penicillin-binding protein-related factor A (putative recombinase)
VTGRAFECEVQQSAKWMRFYYQRIPSSSARGTGVTRFVVANPFDSYLVVNGLFAPIEMKSCRDHGSLSAWRLRANQEEGLAAALHEGACPFLFINMRRIVVSGDKVLKEGAWRATVEKRTVSRNRAWVLPFSQWAALKHELEDIGRKSIPYTWFEDGSRFASMTRLPRHEKRPAIWDLLGGLTEGCKLADAPQYKRLLDFLDPTRFKRSWEEIGVEKEEVSW